MDEKHQFDQNHLESEDHDNDSVQPNQFQTDSYQDHLNTPGINGHRDEETTSELQVEDIDVDADTDTEVDDPMQTDVDTDLDVRMDDAVGWTAIVLSAISFFWLPLLFGAAGIITGFIARNRDANVLGNVAIVAGVIAIIMSFAMR